MAKYYGKIGFRVQKTVRPGVVMDDEIIERPYFGDVLRFSRRFDNSGSVNGEITISDQISILSDPFANNHFYSIVYAEWMGTKWKVSNVSVEYPRLLLELNGVYPEDSE